LGKWLRHEGGGFEMSGGRKLLIAGAAALVVAVGGVGIAQAVGGDSEEQVTGPEADRAKRAAVEAVGGGHVVGVEREDDGDAAWEVEVRKGDREVEVKLDANLQSVGSEIGDDGDRAENDDGEAEDEDED
jgi:hypothetical protein